MGCRARHSCPGAPCPAGERHVKETRSDIFAPHPALSGKKGPQCSPSWACGLTVTRLLVTGPRLPSALCPHPHIQAQSPSSRS